MGVIDIVKRQEREEGKVEGKLQGKLEGKLEEKELLVRNLITKLGLPDHQIADVAEVDVEFVEKVRAKLEQG